ncbi:MAG: hypothetical protein ABIP38_03220, partial [Steroidobacteraceae bacterium]
SYLPSVELQDKLMRWRLYRFLSDHSQFYSVIRETLATALKTFLSRKGREREEPEQASPSSPEMPGAQLAAHLVNEARKQVESDGRTFLLVEIPDYSPSGQPVSVWAKIPAAVVRDVPVVHAGDVFRSLPAGTKLYYNKGHYHLTPIAADALARTIADDLQQPLKDGSCGRRLAAGL